MKIPNMQAKPEDMVMVKNWRKKSNPEEPAILIEAEYQIKSYMKAWLYRVRLLRKSKSNIFGIMMKVNQSQIRKATRKEILKYFLKDV